MVDSIRTSSNSASDALHEQSAQHFAKQRWIGPIGTSAAAFTIYVILRDLVNTSRLSVWLVFMLVATVVQTSAITIPALANWKTRRHQPVMSGVGHIMIGTGGGCLAFVDLGALASDRAVQMAVTSYVFSMALGVAIGTPTMGPYAMQTLIPMWIGTIIGFALANGLILSVALALLAGLLAYGIQQDRILWAELIELRVAASAEAEHQRFEAHTDSLSGLFNRTGADAQLGMLIGDGTAEAMYSVLYIDLDQFKPVNDVHGHASGDEVLLTTGERLRTACRESDVVARIGGDEFMVVIKQDPDDATRPRALVDRLVSVISEPIVLSNGSEVVVHASIGLAEGTVLNGSLDDVVSRADRSMYETKWSSSQPIRHQRVDQS